MDAHSSEPQVIQPRRRKWSKYISLIIVGLLVCGAGGFAGGWLAGSLRGADSGVDMQHMIQSDGSTTVTLEEEAISKVAAKVSPSVVSIVTTTSARSAWGYSSQGAGTGVIVSKDGYIMTNNHVIKGASKVSVVLSDGTEYDKVVVVGSDPLNDIAFVKIEGVSNLTPAELGNSGKLRIGQRVVAIGNALGQFDNTVTSGIVSAMGRPLTASSSDGQSSENLTDLIQTDAAINSGNSGGPLVDLSGRVIGINTAVATDANGIGFAIPINATRGVLAEVLEHGKVARAYLGVRYLDVTASLASSKDLGSKKGAFVYADGETHPVVKGGPADKAGVKADDIILKVDDDVIGIAGSMSSIIGQYRPGDKVTLTVLRDGKEIKLNAELAAYDD
ncbi:MAG TPA: trypsin-like peptidase domain-containing protein [Candidatus Saccharibacteria bacterium]|nr:trypsin-like peptidase domain-containing protein [Candidatus Saccharibacteria bacterium]